MAHAKRLLIVDDDVELCAMLAEYMGASGYEVEAVHDGELGEQRVRTGRYDLVVLDLMLPILSGMDVIRRLRPADRTPIVMLTAKGSTTDRIVGLELGADDYVPKPFDARELLARIEAVLRRATPVSGGDSVAFGPLRLNQANRSAYLGTNLLDLTSGEFDILGLLVSKAGRVVSREELSTQLGRELLPFDRSIDMHIVSLRRKLASEPGSGLNILTVRSAGYQLAARVKERQ